MQRIWGNAFVAMLMTCILAFSLFACAAGEEEEELVYMRNNWNFVEGSIDVSQGIPEDASGRLEKIRKEGKLRVVTEPYYPPQEFIDDSLSGQDRFVGADMELARLIAQRMGVDLEIIPLEFTKVLEGIAEGKYDLAIAALSYTAERAAVMELSKGYYFTKEEASGGIMIRAEDAETIRSTEDLHGKNIVAMRGSLQESMAAENITNYREFRRLASMQDVYDALEEDDADAAVVDIENARAYIARNPDCGLVMVPGVTYALKEQYKGDRVAGPRNELELMYFVNGVIDELLESGQYDKWFEEYAAYASRIGAE